MHHYGFFKFRPAIVAGLLLTMLVVSPLAAQDQPPTPTPALPPTPDLSSLVAVGDAFAAAGQTDKALEYYLKALEAHPDDAAALAAIQRLLAQSGTPTPVSTATLASPFVSVGNAFAAAGQTGKALEYYLKVLETRPDDAAALAGIQRLLARPDDNPRLALAEAYDAAGNHEAALAIYAELLAADGVDEAVRAAALDSVERTRLLPSVARQMERTTLTNAATLLVNCLAVALLLLLLWLLVRQIRARRESNAPGGRLIVVLPFINATGDEATKGMEQGARAVLVDWLVANSAVAEGKTNTRDNVTLDDEPDKVAADTFPDVGLLSKLLNWLAVRTAPRQERLVVEGTLLARVGRKEVGLALTVRERSGGPVSRGWSNYLPAATWHTFEKIADLAAQGASWVYDPGRTLAPAQAVELGEVNRQLALAQVQRAAGETPAARATLQAAKSRTAADDESGGGFAGEAAGEDRYSDALLRYRMDQLKEFLGQL